MGGGRNSVARLAFSFVVLTVGAAVAGEALGPAPFPPENAPNEAKRALGKMLFFEEQLSSDNTVACATCHVMKRGGTDPRRGRNPGSNAKFGDLGDVMGSPGVQPMDGGSTPHPVLHPAPAFGSSVQVTPRTTPTTFAAVFQDHILWDGRASSAFADPLTGQVVVPSGGALESQALLPLTNEFEMGHAGRNFEQIVAKLTAARPLALASNLPSDVAQALSGEPTYPELFGRAFGDDTITPVRIAMAIATYERTLVPDRTKYDRYLAGDSSALTQQAARGLAAMTKGTCTTCHVPPLFTDGSFRATGVRDPKEDKGRAKVTGNDADRGKFKVPTLRNVALKASFFHDGQRAALTDAIDYYAVQPGPIVNGVSAYGTQSASPTAPVPHEQFVDNQDPVMPTISLTAADVQDINAFLTDALVDPRVVSGVYPFDAPTLASQRPEVTTIHHDFQIVQGDRPPQVVVRTPPLAGTEEFTVSVTGAAPGTTAQLVSWQDPTPDGGITVSDPVVVASDNGVSYATAPLPLTAAEPDTHVRLAWRITDPSSGHTVAVTPAVSVVAFAARPKLLAGSEVPVAPPPVVDDTDAYVGSAAFGMAQDLDAGPAGDDTFTCVVWLGAPANGVKLSHGHVSLSVGGKILVAGLPMDARGRVATSFSSYRATASFNAATGRLKISVRGVDLGGAIVAPSSVPVRVELEGLGLRSPVVKTVLSFASTRTTDRLTGVYKFADSGTGNGVFHVTNARARHVAVSRQRLHIEAAIDAPGRDAWWLPGAVTIEVGGPFGFRFEPADPLEDISVESPYGSSVWAEMPDGDLHKLRIDVLRRKLSLDFTGDIPALDGAAPGARVQLPVKLTMRPSASAAPVTFTTTATVTVARR